MSISEDATSTEKPLIERLAANEPRFTLSEVATMLSVEVETVAAWYRRGIKGIRLQLVKIGGGWVCFYKELSEFLESVKRAAESDTATIK